MMVDLANTVWVACVLLVALAAGPLARRLGSLATGIPSPRKGKIEKGCSASEARQLPMWVSVEPASRLSTASGCGQDTYPQSPMLMRSRRGVGQFEELGVPEVPDVLVAHFEEVGVPDVPVAHFEEVGVPAASGRGVFPDETGTVSEGKQAHYCPLIGRDVDADSGHAGCIQHGQCWY